MEEEASSSRRRKNNLDNSIRTPYYHLILAPLPRPQAVNDTFVIREPRIETEPCEDWVFTLVEIQTLLLFFPLFFLSFFWWNGIPSLLFATWCIDTPFQSRSAEQWHAYLGRTASSIGMGNPQSASSTAMRHSQASWGRWHD